MHDGSKRTWNPDYDGLQPAVYLPARCGAVDQKARASFLKTAFRRNQRSGQMGADAAWRRQRDHRIRPSWLSTAARPLLKSISLINPTRKLRATPSALCTKWKWCAHNPGLGGNLNNAIVIDDTASWIPACAIPMSLCVKLMPSDLYIVGHPIVGAFQRYNRDIAINNATLRAGFGRRNGYSNT